MADPLKVAVQLDDDPTPEYRLGYALVPQPDQFDPLELEQAIALKADADAVTQLQATVATKADAGVVAALDARVASLEKDRDRYVNLGDRTTGGLIPLDAQGARSITFRVNLKTTAGVSFGPRNIVSGATITLVVEGCNGQDVTTWYAVGPEKGDPLPDPLPVLTAGEVLVVTYFQAHTTTKAAWTVFTNPVA